MKHKLIRIIALLCLMTIFFESTAFATSTYSTGISASEISAISSAMEIRGMDGPVSIDVLYDLEHNPSYLLGWTPTGEFLIMIRNSLSCLEWGESNPYSSIMDADKYYGGILNYYANSSTGMYCLTTGDKLDSLNTVISNYELSNSQLNTQTSQSPSYSAAATSVATLIPQSTSLIKRRAFGYNTDGSCSSVASCIAINYLDQTINANIVPTNMQLEQLVGSTFNASTYPKADRFHKYIRDTCQMGTDTLPGDVVTGVTNYRESNATINATGISIEWLGVSKEDVVNEILNQRPAMISTTYEPGYSLHTMVIYGYQEYSDSTIGWLVHPGWYSQINNDLGYYAITEHWISPSACTLYKFSCNG